MTSPLFVASVSSNSSPTQPGSLASNSSPTQPGSLASNVGLAAELPWTSHRPSPKPSAGHGYSGLMRFVRALGLWMTRQRAVRALGLFGCCCVLSFPRPARAFVHIVQPGDTLASIAETFYGKIQHERLLVAANSLDMEGGIRIVPGMRLEVPALTYVRVTEGQTWKDIASRLLGGEHRAHALADANDSKAWLTPVVDAEIVVPYNLRFVCTGDETIVGLAYRFLGDRKKAWALDQYNDRKGRRLVRGEVVLIPITDLELAEKGRLAAAAAQHLETLQLGGASRLAQAKVARGMDLLERDIRHGHYVEAVHQGTSFLSMGQLTKQQRARIARLLLEAYVALDARGLAKDSCAQWLEEDPRARLDPDELSPKIIDICKEAKP